MLLAAPQHGAAFGLETLWKGRERRFLPHILPGSWLEKVPVQAEGCLARDSSCPDV